MSPRSGLMFYVSSMGDFPVPAMLCYGSLMVVLYVRAIFTDPLHVTMFMNPLLAIIDYTMQSRERGNAARTSGSSLERKSMAKREDYFLSRCTK